MMRPLLQYETRPYSSNPIYLIRAYGEGFKRCTGCDVMIKTEGARCPSCKRILKTRTQRGSKAGLKEAFKKLPSKVEHVCSVCNATHSSTYNKGLCTYERWHRDGNGGWHCESCHKRKERENNREEMARRQREYRQKNREKVREWEKKYRAKPEYKEKASAYGRKYEKENRKRLTILKRLQNYDPLNLRKMIISIKPSALKVG